MTFDNDQMMCVLGLLAIIIIILFCNEKLTSLMQAAKGGAKIPTLNNTARKLLMNMAGFNQNKWYESISLSRVLTWLFLFWEIEMPFFIPLRGFQNGRNHCVAIVWGHIIDCLGKYPFPIVKDNLDYVLGQFEVFMGISHLLHWNHAKRSWMVI